MTKATTDMYSSLPPTRNLERRNSIQQPLPCTKHELQYDKLFRKKKMVSRKYRIFEHNNLGSCSKRLVQDGLEPGATSSVFRLAIKSSNAYKVDASSFGSLCLTQKKNSHSTIWLLQSKKQDELSLAAVSTERPNNLRSSLKNSTQGIDHATIRRSNCD